MGAIHEVGRQKTIIMIAHRLSSVRHCDMILVMDQGKYGELIITSDRFRDLVIEHAGE